MKPQSSKYALFALLFLCFAAAILGDSSAEALLLANFPASLIPRMYLINALFLFVASAFIMPIIDRMNRGVLFLGYTIVHGWVLMIAWAAVQSGVTFLYIPLFSYAYVSKILMFLLFWTLANDLTDSRQAGRDFPFIAAGGTLGAIGISFAIPGLLKIMEAGQLLPIWACLSILVGVGFAPIVRRHSSVFRPARKHLNAGEPSRLKSLGSDVQLLGSQPLLRTMSIFYFLLFVLLLSQQFSFYQVIRGRFDDAKQLAGFLGYFNGVSMAGTFLLQMTVSGRLIRAIGSTRAMFLLPAALCLVFGGLLLTGTLIEPPVDTLVLFWAIVGGVALRIAFFDSFFSPNFQVFFSSLPREIRGRAKLAIEGAVKPGAIALASVWLIVAPLYLSFSMLMAVYLACSVVMVVLVFRLRRDYTLSLTRYLAGFNIRHKKGVLDVGRLAGAENIYQALDEMLKTENLETAGVIVEVLAQMNNVDSVAVLKEHITHANPHLRSRIVSALTPLRRDELKPLFRSLLADEDFRVVSTAVPALAAFEEHKVNVGLQIFINHENNRVRANALIALWKGASHDARGWYEQTLMGMLFSDDKKENASALFVLSELSLGEFAQKLLHRYFTEHRATILSDRKLWHWYLRAVTTNKNQKLLGTLEKVAETSSQRRRGDLARLFCSILSNGYEINQYVQRMEKSHGIVRELYLQGLFLTRRAGGLSGHQIDSATLIAMAMQERREIHRAWHALGIIEEDGGVAGELFGYAVRELYVERKILALQYIAAILDDTGQISTILHRFNHENNHVRARALEVLDNTGNSKVNRWLLELLDSPDQRMILRSAQTMGVAYMSDIASVLSHYGSEKNPWVRLCASHMRERMQNPTTIDSKPMSSEEANAGYNQ